MIERLRVLATAVILLQACDSVGACDHVYQDPVLTIQRVDGGSSGPLTAVSISDVLVAAQVVDPSRLITRPAFGLSLVNGVLRCDLACGFGVVEGSYQFTVSAAGHSDRRVTATASYPKFDAGCPSRNSGSTQITVSLDPIG